MEKEKKIMEKKTTRQPYRKPQLEQVQLIAEEAVLSNCKTATTVNPGTDTIRQIGCYDVACYDPGS